MDNDGFSAVDSHYYDSERREKLIEKYLLEMLDTYRDNSSLRPIYFLHRMLTLHVKNTDIHTNKTEIHAEVQKEVREAVTSMMLFSENLEFQVETIKEALEHNESVDILVEEYINAAWYYFLKIEILIEILFSHPSNVVASDEQLLRTNRSQKIRDSWLEAPYRRPRFPFARELGHTYLGEEKPRY